MGSCSGVSRVGSSFLLLAALRASAVAQGVVASSPEVLPPPLPPLADALPSNPLIVPGADAGCCGCASLAPRNNVGAISDLLPPMPGGPALHDVGPRDVHLHLGEFHTEKVDLYVPGRGLDVLWGRRYRSRLGPDTAQGMRWDFSYNVSITASGDDLLLADGNGRLDRYKLQPDGSYVSRGFARRGTFIVGGKFELLFADRGRWIFKPLGVGAAAGKLETISDSKGNTILLTYAGNGRLTTITDTLGRNVSVAYDVSGRIASVTDFTGRSVVYQYYDGTTAGGSLGDLKSVRSPVVVGTPNGNDFPSGKTTTYTYTKGFAAEALNHNLLTVTEPNGQVSVSNTYAATQDPQDPDYDRLTRIERGGPAGATKITYLPIWVAQASPGVVSPSLGWLVITNDPLGHVVHFRYDALGRLLHLREYTGAADPGLPTTLHANRPTGPLRPDDPPFFLTTVKWNDELRPIRMVVPSKAEVRATWASDLDPAAPPLTRGNLLQVQRLRAGNPEPADQAELLDAYEYMSPPDGLGSDLVVQHTDPQGGVTTFVRDGTCNITSVVHRLPSIVEFWEYNAFGQATAHVLPDNGNGWLRRDEFTYYPNGPQLGYQQKRIVDANALALTTTYEYDALGNRVRVTDPEGSDTQFVVNALDQVVRRISPEVSPGSGIRYQRDLFYDANDNLVQLDDQNKDADGVLQANAQLTTLYEYDALDRLVRTTTEVDASHDVVEELVYDAEGGLVLFRAGQAVNGQQPGNVTAFAYDERHRLFQVVRGGGAATETSQVDYDLDGHRKRVVLGTGAEAAAEVSVFDAFGRTLSTTDALGNVTTIHWSPNSQSLSTRVDGELHDVAGGAGNVRLSERHATYDAMDRLSSSEEVHVTTDTQLPIGDGLITRTYTYSGTGQLLHTLDDNGNLTVRSYDTADRAALEVDALGNSIAWTRDGRDDVVAEMRTSLSGTGGAPLVATTSYVHDGLGRLLDVHDPLGGVRRWRLDSGGNRVETSDALVGVGAVGNVIHQEFDGIGRLLKVRRMLTDNGQGDGQPTGEVVTQQAWDDSSRLVARTDPDGHVTQYAYDAADRLATTTHADGTTETLGHDGRGNVVTRLDPNGTLITNTWDALDRLIGVAVVLGAGVAPDTTAEAYEYDGTGRLTRATNDKSVVQRVHDTNGTVRSETINGRTVLAVEDGHHNLLSLTYPNGALVTATADALNRVKSVTDPVGLVATLEYLGPWWLQRIDYGNGTRLDVSYDANGLVSQTSNVRVAGGVLLDGRTFGHDAMDNTTSELNQVTGQVTTWTYDSLARLVRSTRDPLVGPTTTITYALDGAGNRTSVQGGPDQGDYVSSATAPEPADFQVNQYTQTPFDDRLYDSNGNLLQRDDAAPGVWSFAYDARDRLVSATNTGSGLHVTYAYDALGRLVERVADPGGLPVTRRFSYFGNDRIEAVDELGATKGQFVYAGRDRLVLKRNFGGPGPARQFMHMTMFGDVPAVVAVTGPTSSVVERYEYGDFGAPIFLAPGGSTIPATTIANDVLYHARPYDAATGLCDLRHRWLDPRAGRFIQRDPIGTWGDDDNLGNAFTFVGNNPRTYADPTGLYKDLDFHSCTSSEKGDVTDAAEYAEDWAHDCEDHFDGHKKSEEDNCYYYKRWFGDYDAGDYDFVRNSVFDEIGDKFANKTIDFECNDPDCPADVTVVTSTGSYTSWTNAYVYFGAPYYVHLCPHFFSDYSSKNQGRIVEHEMSHEVQSEVVDKAYGEDESLDLAEDSPSKAVNNADNYGWCAYDIQ